MATRFYTDPTNAPTVSPDFVYAWDDTTQAVRRKLVIDTRGNNGSTDFEVTETATFYDEILFVQFVSEPLDSISATLPVMKNFFRFVESNAKANCTNKVRWGKCDSDGSNSVAISAAGYTSGPEFNDGDTTNLANRGWGESNGTDTAFSQGDRLIVEVGVYFDYAKVSSYTATISITDNHATTDLPENDTETAAYNSWFESGDTFTEASGEPATMKLGPMFAFA